MRVQHGMGQLGCSTVAGLLLVLTIVHAEVIQTALIDKTPAKKGMAGGLMQGMHRFTNLFTALCYHFDKSGMMIDMITCSCNTCSSVCKSMPTCYYSQWGALPVVRHCLRNVARFSPICSPLPLSTGGQQVQRV